MFKQLAKLTLCLVFVLSFANSLMAQVIPDPIKISEAKTKVGKMVTVFGTVSSANFRYPELGFYLSDTTGTMFVEGVPYAPFAANTGDAVFVTGYIQNENGDYKIKDNSSMNFSLIVGAQNFYIYKPKTDTIALDNLMSNLGKFEGKTVVLRNIKIVDSAKWVKDILKFKDFKTFDVTDVTDSSKTASVKIFGTTNIDGQKNPLTEPRTIKCFVANENNTLVLIPGSISDLGGTYIAPTGYMAIEEAKMNGKTNITVRGIVTSPNWGGSTNAFFIQDATAGLYLYKTTVTMNIGDSVEATGDMTIYNNLYELTVKDSKVIKSNVRQVKPTELTVAQFNLFPEYYEGQLVKILNIQKTPSAIWPDPSNTKTGVEVSFQDITNQEKTIPIYVRKDSKLYGKPITIPVNVIGLVNQYKNTYEIVARDTFDYQSINQAQARLLTKSGVSSCNYPNPFNPTTTIAYSLPSKSNVSLKIFDVTGRLVETLVNNMQQEAGVHSFKFDGASCASGFYIYELKAGNQRITQKMLLVK